MGKLLNEFYKMYDENVTVPLQISSSSWGHILQFGIQKLVRMVCVSSMYSNVVPFLHLLSFTYVNEQSNRPGSC